MRRHPHGPLGYDIRVMLTNGDEAGAQKLLDALNHGRRIFGEPLLEMPPPFERGLPDLCAVEARATTMVDRELRRTIEIQQRKDAA